MATSGVPIVSVRNDDVPADTKQNVPEVLSGSVVSKSWEEFLNQFTHLSERTKQEVIEGRLTLLRNRMAARDKEVISFYEGFSVRDMAKLDAKQGEEEAQALFRLHDFERLNNCLIQWCKDWNISIKTACARVIEDSVEGIKVRAITSAGNIDFFVPNTEPFPNEELMTKLQLINASAAP